MSSFPAYRLGGTVKGMIVGGAHPELYGSYDFVAYWTGYQLFAGGLNPYDTSLIAEIQRELGASGQTVLFKNPPWLLWIMSPVLSLPFQTAVHVWIAMNCLMFALSVGLLAAVWKPRLPQLLVGITACAAFAPFWSTLQYGQMSVLLLFFLSLLLWCYEKRFLLGAGCALAGLSLKPQLFLCLLPFLVVTAIRLKSFKLLGGLCGSIAVLVLVTILLSPRSLLLWGESFFVRPQVPDGSFSDYWFTSSIPGFLRATGVGVLPPQLLIALPYLIGAIGAACGIFLARPNAKGPFRENMTTAVGLGIVLAPYCWFFDFVLLVPLVLGIFFLQYQSILRCSILLVALTLLSAFAQPPFFTRFDQLIWFPAAVCILWGISVNSKEKFADERPT